MENSPPLVCKICQASESNLDLYGKTSTDLLKSNLCLHCWLWEQRARNNRNKNQVRVNGKLYIILHSRLSSDNYMYSHGIEFKNGKKIHTTRLAYIGEIPEHFRSRLPDNARFIEK